MQTHRDGRVGELKSGDADLARARMNFQVVVRITGAITLAVLGFMVYLTAALASRLARTEPGQHAATSLLFVGAYAPVMVVVIWIVVRQVSSADAVADARQVRLDEQSRRRDLEVQIADALEMADNEHEALKVIERGFSVVLPEQPVELLLADNSHAHLTLRAATSPGGVRAGCQVASPQECPAARRARVHHFPDSEAVNACPKLSARDGGRCAALCIPVSIMGRTVGVIHSVQDVGTEISSTVVSDLQAVANQAGARLGMLRIMSETQLQASTDGLTGLLNRRAFENGFLGLRSTCATAPAVVAMADLDHFKTINDTYGHETGDRALRVFSETLRHTLRDRDLLSRRGGEEFSVVFPECDLAAAASALGRVRVELQSAIQQAGLPVFTVSFGMVPARLDDDLDTLLGRADAALFEAKRTGRDRVVIHDHRPAAASSGSLLEGPVAVESD